jgi:cell division protein FtsQ
MSSPDSVLLNDVLHFTKVIQNDSFFMAQIAQVNIEANGDFEMVPSLGDHLVLMGTAENIEDKLNRLYSFYKQVWVNSGVNAYQVLDCRFDHQIVALKKGMQPIQFSASMLVNDSLENWTSASLSGSSITSTKLDTTKNAVAPVKIDSSLKPKAPALLNKVTSNVVKSNSKATPKITPKNTVVANEKLKGKTKPKTTLKKNNKTNNKSLNNKKKSAKAVMPKKTQAKTTNN